MFDLQNGILTNLKKWVEIYEGTQVQVNLCQKLFFLYQLIHTVNFYRTIIKRFVINSMYIVFVYS